MEILINKNVQKFTITLQKNTIAKVLRITDLLEEFGHNLPMPYSKKIRPNLFELRVRGEQEVRIFYAFKSSRIIFLHGFVKKTSKIPNKEINTALERLKSIDV